MDHMDDTFSSDDDQKKTMRMRVTPDHLSYADALLASTPAECLDHRAFALSFETTHSKRMELPTITRLLELICAQQYDYAHDDGVLDTCLNDLVRQRAAQLPTPEILKLFSS